MSESVEPVKSQIRRLAQWIMENVPGEPSRSEGAVDTAIRIMARGLEQEGHPPTGA